MIINKIAALTLFFGFVACEAHSQTYTDDIFLYSRTTFSGTARTQSLAGAQTSLGGDLGSLSANPAGLGFFRRSDFSLSPMFTNNFVNSSYQGSKFSNSKNTLDFGNMGVVWATSTPQADEAKKGAGWLSYAFGIGYSRTADFNSNLSFAGKNSSSSFTQFLANQANQYEGTSSGVNFDQSGGATDQSLPGQAYNGYLIDRVTDPTTKKTSYASAATLGNGSFVSQSGSNYQAGSINDINLSFGTNYGNVLYLGLGANISTLHYSYGFNFNETGLNSAGNTAPTGLAYNENFEVAGTGFSAKAGLIFRPVESFRVGGYIQTPTWYKLTESTDNAQVTGVNSSGQPNYSPNPAYIDYSSSYSVKTPWRYNFGASYFFKTYGFLSADVELVDYRSANFHSSDNSFNSSVNTTTNASLASAVNYRLGAEVRLGLVSLRGGYALYGNPYNASRGPSSEATSYTGGIGYRSRNFYIDGAVINTAYNSSYQAYTVSQGLSPSAFLKNTRTDVMITFGSRF